MLSGHGDGLLSKLQESLPQEAVRAQGQESGCFSGKEQCIPW